MTRSRCAWFILLLCCLTLFCPPSRAEVSVRQRCEELFLERDWKGLQETMVKDSTLASDPVARLMVAHSCLALNRSTQAALLFLSCRDEDASKICLEWAKGLAKIAGSGIRVDSNHEHVIIAPARLNRYS